MPAGFLRNEHQGRCPASPMGTAATSSEVDELVRRLTPVILKAGTRAGIAAVLTLIAIGVIVAVVGGVFKLAL